MNNKIIPKAVIERVPLYLDYLDKLIDNDNEMVSSKMISQDLGLGEVQVRKDLNIISGKGKPKIGYIASDLRNDLESLIRNEEKTNVVIIGAGKIGEALANYNGFKKYGFNIIAVFDNDLNKIGKKISDKAILSIDMLKDFCLENDVEIVMLAVPSKETKNVCDILKESRIKGILNFTKSKIDIQENICVRNVDMASLLIMLAVEINNNLNYNKGE